MDALLKILADIRQHVEESMVLLVSHTGVIYRVDLVSGQFKWHYDTKRKTYQPYQASRMVGYVDVAGENPFYYSGSSPKVVVILAKTEDEMKDQIKCFFEEDPQITSHTYVFYLNSSTGKKAEGDHLDDDPNLLKIERTDWNVSMGASWSLMYSKLDVSVQCSESPQKRKKCRVMYARTPENFIEICRKYSLVGVLGDCILSHTINQSRTIRLYYPEKKICESKGKICYLGGCRNKGEVFVKRVPIEDKSQEVINIYTKFSNCDHVARLLAVEDDEQYHYLAFERFKGDQIEREDGEWEDGEATLGAFLRCGLVCPDERQGDGVPLLGKVVEALRVVHARDVLHCNLNLEHVLVRTTKIRTTPSPSDNIFTIKLCGLGQSKYFDSSNFKSTSPLYMKERQDFAALTIAFMTSGSYECAPTELHDGYEYMPFGKSKFTDGMKKLGVLAKDLVTKLVEKKILMTFHMVSHHLLFWEWSKQLSFLKDASDDIFNGDLIGIEDIASKVLPDGDWQSTIEENESAKTWFAYMRQALEQRKGEGEVIEELQKDNKVKQPAYNTRKVGDLLRLVRNSYNHRYSNYPGNGGFSLWSYITKQFPNLLLEVYYHIMEKGKKTYVFRTYLKH